MTNAMPERQAVAAAMTQFQAVTNELTTWQTRIQTATAGIFAAAKTLHAAAVAARLAVTPIPPLVAKASRPVQPALTAAGITTLAQLGAALPTDATVAGLSTATTAHLREWYAKQVSAVTAATPLTLDFEEHREASLTLVTTAIAWPDLTAVQQALAPLQPSKPPWRPPSLLYR